MSYEERHAAAETAGKNKSKKGKMTPLGKLLDTIGAIIMILCILMCLALTVPTLAGIKTYVVVSGSMEPTIPVGSLIYARQTDPATLQKGDVIVFYSTNAADADASGGAVPITHRVVENHTDTGEVITKGDANEKIDMFPAVYINIVGKVLIHVPWLGIPASLFTSRIGKIAAVLVILAGYLLTEAGRHMRR